MTHEWLQKILHRKYDYLMNHDPTAVEIESFRIIQLPLEKIVVSLAGIKKCAVYTI